MHLISLGRIVLVVLSAFVAFMVVEITLRVSDGQSILEFTNYLHDQTDTINTLQNSEYHPVLGWTLKENIHVTQFFPGFPEQGDFHKFTTTGAYGIRMHGFDIEPPPEDAFLAVGDSFTAGSEVAGNETWPAYLENLIGTPVINAGVGGWGADQIVLRAEQLIPVVNPIGIVVSFLADDILRNRNRTFGGINKPYFTVDNGVLTPHNIPVPRYSANIRDMGYIRLLTGYSYVTTELLKAYAPDLWNERFTQIYNFVDNDPVGVTCALVRRLKRRADEVGTQVFIIIQHGLGRVAKRDAAPAHGSQVVDCVRAMGIRVLDTWEHYQKVKRVRGVKGLQEFTVMHQNNTVYGHCSPEGNRFVAELIRVNLLPKEFRR